MSKPKYSEVEEWIKNEIYRGFFRDGEKIPSENKLMEKFGYSRQTIRQALHNLEEAGFLKSVRGSGTFVEMKNFNDENEKKVIAVLMNSLENHEETEILSGIETVLAENNCTLSLGVTHNRHRSEYEVMKSLIESNVDGFIINGTKTALINPNYELWLKIDEHFPCVYTNSGNAMLYDKIPAVACDDIEAGYQAAKYLIERGHRDISIILRTDSIESHKRYLGYIKALHEADIPFSDDNVMWCLYEDMEDLFEQLIEKLFSKNLYKCTAVLCQNNSMVQSLMNFLQKIHLKPYDDVSFLSFEDSELAEKTRLTCVSYDRRKIGEEAAKLCLKMMKGGKKENIVIPSKIVGRDSVRVINREKRTEE